MNKAIPLAKLLFPVKRHGRIQGPRELILRPSDPDDKALIESLLELTAARVAQNKKRPARRRTA